MSKKNIIILVSSISIVTLTLTAIMLTKTDDIEIPTAETDTTIEQLDTQEDVIQLTIDSLPYTTEGDLYIPPTDNVVDFDEDLNSLTTEDLKEVLEEDTETGFITGVTQGNNIVTIIPEEYQGSFDKAKA
ncbi:MAG: hypothetical protein R3Y12_02075 [Clostridia bacterium]